jgi:hypothetical protein
MNGKNWIFGAVAAVGCAVALSAPRPAAAQCYGGGGYVSIGWHSRHGYVSAYYVRRHHRPHYRHRTVVVYRTVPVYRTVGYYPAYHHHYWCRHRHVTGFYVSGYGDWHARHSYGCY